MRISRHQLFMGIAELAAKRSTCFRGNVGAVIVVDNNPVAIGYNGPPSGEPHCQGNDCPLTNGGCSRSIHAEDNALARASVYVYGPYLADLYVTSSPCHGCAARIIQSHMIRRVFYQSPYRITTGIEELIHENIDVYRFSPSGYLVEEKTGRVLEAN